MRKDDDPAYYSNDEEERPKQSTHAGGEKPGYASANLTGWKDLMLMPELMKAIEKAGFEHPSEVQQECIPYAVEGADIICQAKSGMGKTAVFVLSILNQMAGKAETEEQKQIKECSCIVVSHTRELAYQILKDFKRLGQFIKQSSY